MTDLLHFFQLKVCYNLIEMLYFEKCFCFLFKVNLTFDYFIFSGFGFIKVAGTHMRYFVMNKFFEELHSQGKFWLDMTGSLHVRINVLPREVGYLF